MDSMEDDKLDFGDLDDLDIPQDGFTGEIEDMAELERELGLDSFDDINTQPLATTNSDLSKQTVSAPSLEKTTVQTPSIPNKNNNNPTVSSSRINNTSPNNNNKPFVARGKPPYQNKTQRYNPYNTQQPIFQNMPYPGLSPFNVMPMAGHFGQGFMNMQLPNGNNMGLPMMGNNTMSNGPIPSRRIHVNPKFAAAHPPPQSNDQVEQAPQRPHKTEQPSPERQPKQEHHQGNQRKRSADVDEPDTPTNIGQHSPYRRRLDTTPASTSLIEPSLQSRLGKGNFDIPVTNGVSESKRGSDPLHSRPSGSSGFSIRGAALAAAAAASSDASLSHRSQNDRTSQVNGNQSSFSIQGRSSALRGTSNNDSPSIISRLNNNKKNNDLRNRQPSTKPTNGTTTKGTILQRLGEGRITKNTKKMDSPTDRQNTRSIRNETLTPIFANGKSSKLIVSNLSPHVTESTLKSLEPKDIKMVSLDQDSKNATLLFAGIDSAVTFRRKFNRTTLSGEHISVNFAKN